MPSASFRCCSERLASRYSPALMVGSIDSPSRLSLVMIYSRRPAASLKFKKICVIGIWACWAEQSKTQMKSGMSGKNIKGFYQVGDYFTLVTPEILALGNPHSTRTNYTLTAPADEIVLALDY